MGDLADGHIECGGGDQGQEAEPGDGSRINKYHVCRYFKKTETDLSVDEFWAVIDF